MKPSIRIPYSVEFGLRLEELIRYAEFKQLADNLALLHRQKRFRTLAVLSFMPGEGKTLFCSAIARAYAEISRMRVLVIDTATFRRPGSLALRSCLEASPSVYFMCLGDYKKHLGESLSARRRMRIEKALAGFRISGNDSSAPYAMEVQEPALRFGLVEEGPCRSRIDYNDEFLVRNMMEEYAEQYDLIIADTPPLTAANKNNIDPVLIARKSDASVLVASRTFLDSPDVAAHLGILKDPALRLIGVIANEEFPS